VNQLAALVSDLEDLSKRYLELHPRHEPMSSDLGRIKKREERLIHSGQIFIDFYRDTFIPKYSPHDGEIFRCTNTLLSYLSDTASRAIREYSYFGLDVLLMERGSNIDDPNRLEVLIRDAKGSIST